MIVIRREQIDRMSELMREEYYRNLTAYFRARVPALVRRLDDAQLSERIAAAVPRARANGVESADGIVKFVSLALAAGPAFEEDPQVRRFLDLPRIGPELKIHILLERTARNLVGGSPA